MARRPGRCSPSSPGAHGTEYSSILAVEKLIQVLDPAQISGTVILVPLVNVASFEQKIAHVNPVDNKSMNRFYPGKADGTQTERASFLMTKEVVDQCDHLIDLHGGDLDESLRPYLVLDRDGQHGAGRDLEGDAARLRPRHHHRVGRPPEGPGGVALPREHRQHRGKPSITAEAGHAGTTETDDIAALANGCLNVMRYLRMLPGAPGGHREPGLGREGDRRPERADGHLLSAGEARHLRPGGHEGGIRHRLRGQGDLRDRARPSRASCSTSAPCRRSPKARPPSHRRRQALA